MFGDASDHVTGLGALELDNSLDGQVVGLGRTARENHLLRRWRSDESGDLRSGRLQSLGGYQPVGVGLAGRISETLGEKRQHSLQNAWIDR